MIIKLSSLMRTLNIKLKSSDDKSFLLHSLNADVAASSRTSSSLSSSPQKNVLNYKKNLQLPAQSAAAAMAAAAQRRRRHCGGGWAEAATKLYIG